MTKLYWEIVGDNGLFLEARKSDFVALRYEPDDAEILIHIDDIDDMIEALKRVRSHYRTLELVEEEKAALERWGKEKIPCE